MIDALADTGRAEKDKILGLPALLRLDGDPRRVVGDLSNSQKVADYLRL